MASNYANIEARYAFALTLMKTKRIGLGSSKPHLKIHGHKLGYDSTTSSPIELNL